jgi:2-amino-4-hydroxy-6-hydroxymethyldihydropteridine diphosphokinase
VTIAYIGVGSNVGERTSFCRRAVEELASIPGISVEAVSSLYETSPVGGPPQRSFVNLVVKIDTAGSPDDLLKVCKTIERRLGREPGDIRWGPRVADLDILLFGDEKVSEPGLEIPHPRMSQRRFVLTPLLEIDREVTDPWGTRYADALTETEGEVEFLESF